jgi:hypothetical protein
LSSRPRSERSSVSKSASWCPSGSSPCQRGRRPRTNNSPRAPARDTHGRAASWCVWVDLGDGGVVDETTPASPLSVPVR